MTQKAFFRREISRIAQRIATLYRPKKIILFGSAVKGKITNDSDIDLLIIKNTSLPRHSRAQKIYRLLRDINYSIPLEPLVFTPKEVEERVQLGDFFIEEILREGKVLYPHASV